MGGEYPKFRTDTHDSHFEAPVFVAHFTHPSVARVGHPGKEIVKKQIQFVDLFSNTCNE